MSGTSAARMPTLNLAIGPSCFVRCLGCYNHFGKTAAKGGLVTRDELAPFLVDANELGIEQVTVSGGDPLSHPDILGILEDLSDIGFRIKLDTVGTAFLRTQKTAFYGSEVVHQVDLFAVAELVDELGLPLDGSNDQVQDRFRRVHEPASSASELLLPMGSTEFTLLDSVETRPARHSVVADTLTLLGLTSSAGLSTCINTVVHRHNISDLTNIAKLLLAQPPKRWQLFEFTPTGPLAALNRGDYQLDPRSGSAVTDLTTGKPMNVLFDEPSINFDVATNTAMRLVRDSFEVEAKSSTSREGIYFLVNDAGVAWQPGDAHSPAPRELGHVLRERAHIRRVLEGHIASYGLSAG